MNSIFRFTSPIYLALSIVLFTFTTESFAGRYVNGTVERIVDGDTTWVKGPSGRLKIRMLNIDAPESHFPTDTHGVVGQRPWGEQATSYLQDQIKVGDAVTVDTWGLDKYGRTLGYILRGNRDVNYAMVTGGWAVPYILCSGGKECSHDFFTEHHVRQYLTACDDARIARKGIWNHANPLTEMPYDFRNRMAGRQPTKYVGDFETMQYYDPQDQDKVDVCRRVFFPHATDARRLGFKKH